MANFNQNPLGQASVSVDISNFGVTIGATTANVTSGASSFGVQGSSGILSLAQVETGTFDVYPSYRRPIRLVESTPVS